jgi:hypothetical protein
VHHIRIVLTGEDISGPTHICGELIDLIDVPQNLVCDRDITQVAYDEVIGSRSVELGIFQINTPYPITIPLEPANQVTANKSASACNENSLHLNLLFVRSVADSFARPGLWLSLAATT